jgi:hypothetical protein
MSRKNDRKEIWALVVATVVVGQAAAAAAATYRLIGWNNLGMHCMDADYSVSALLPPYNTIHAQLTDPQGRLVRDPNGITVTYQAVADPDGSINTTSAGKTNFWMYVQALFGVAPLVDAGLADHDMPGAANVPQPMAFDPVADWFVAEGIPITPYDDEQHPQPYPLMRLIARDGTGAVLASTDIVLPVSDEMDCRSCHASNSSPSAQPIEGWINAADPQRDMRLNILRLHDDREGGTAAFQNALAAAGYNADGLYSTVVMDGTPVLCARCHASEALPGSGIDGIEPLTQAVHRRMASVVDPLTGNLLDAGENRAACYRCHPGAVTRCLRGAMGNAVAADGSRAMQCQSCHGSMRTVASATRTGWLDEPVCQSCHTGTAIHNNGQIRYLSAFESDGRVRVAVDQTFATNPDAPDAGHSLYRFSTGHGGLTCEACHGSTHAEFPSAQRNDNMQSVALQGHAGMLAECTACHPSSPDTVSGGPHGMHPVGQVWVSRHADAFEEGGGLAQCTACHGADYRGTELSRAQADRNLSTEFGPRQIWRGAQIGCYTCHRGPSDSRPNPNHAPQIDDASASTSLDTAASIALEARDPDNDPLTLRVISQPSHGTAGLSGTVVTFYPEPGFAGNDAFTVAAWDGSAQSNLGTVSVSVAGAAPTPTPTVSPTPADPASACVGDCDGSHEVTVDELIVGVNIALENALPSDCPAFDCNQSGQVTIDCLLQAVNAALDGCGGVPAPTASATPTATPASPPPASPTPASPTPTTNPAATLATIQATIFSTTCTDAGCHTSATRAGNLVLEAGQSHDQLVGVPPDNLAARQAGLNRVQPGDPNNSFLIIKLMGPSLPQGSRMPFGKPPLTAEQIQLIRDWITQGALP